MADVTGTVLLRGEGGAVQAYDLPLRPAFADAVAAGRLVAVDEDGDQVDLPDPEVEVDDPEVEVDDAAGAPDADNAQAASDHDGPPAKSAKVDDWRAYAATLGADEDLVAAMTKAQVITWVDDNTGTPAADKEG